MEHTLEVLRSSFIDSQARKYGIEHGFFTRLGGISTGFYKSLNIGFGSGDDLESVTENRQRVADWAHVSRTCLLIPYQIHSGNVIVVTEAFSESPPQADALVTNTTGLALGIMSADCGPILFADPATGIIGAAHAGWRGTLKNILENTVDSMVSIGANRSSICAVLGPSISQENYEVGEEFRETFYHDNPQNMIYFKPTLRKGYFMFDLQTCIIDRLMQAGVEPHTLARCTYAEEELFHSYRRSTHKNEKVYGRQVSVIVRR